MPSKDQAGKTLKTARRISLTPTTRAYRDWVGNTDTRDLYRFTASSQSSLNLTLEGLKANATLQLLNSKGKPLQVSANPDRQSESIYRNLLPGTYFVQVSPVKGNTAYRLKLSAVADRAGDSVGTALDLGTPTSLTLQEWLGQSDLDDYYRISLLTRSQLGLGLRTLTADATVQVLAANGGAIASLVSPLAQASISAASTVLLDAGTYNIRVNLNRATTSTYYTLDLALGSAPISIEPSLSPVSEPIPSPVPEPSLSPVSEPIPSPVPEPIPSPVSEPIPSPVSEPIPSPVPEALPEPIPNPIPNPSPEPIPSPVPNPSPEPSPIPDPIPSPGLVFQFSTDVGVSQTVVNALTTAGSLWSDRFSDNVTMDVVLRFSDEPSGAASTLIDFSYSAVRAALVNDQTSTDDAIALTHLPNASAFKMLINYTTNSPRGYESPTPYLDNDGDANNSTIRMTTSNAKAMGLQLSNGAIAGTFLGGDEARDLVIILPETGLDGLAWDFDRSDGIADGTVDFIGIVAHEIGHALGFSSGVDILDRGVTRRDDEWTWVNTLDLFRYSTASVAAGSTVVDWTASNTNKYFSIDGGTTRLASFSRGIENGDGVFPGHWKEDSTGFMSATLSPFIGQEAEISALDTLALDVIGWDVA